MQQVTICAIAVMIAIGAAPACGRPAPSGGACDEQCRRIADIVDPIIEAEMAQSGMPGAAFVFVQGSRVPYQRGYGISDVETRTLADARRTVWPIASITKIVTALAAMQLVEAGKIDLDTDVNRYLKRIEVPAQAYTAVTLRHLLSHTGGLDELPGRQFDGKSPPDLAAFLRTRLIRYRPPGELTAYSSYGVALTGVLIEDVSGLSYADYLGRRIFGPAGMVGAKVMRKTGDERGVATPYRLNDGKAIRVPHEWYVTTPSSSVAATAEGMSKILIALLNGGTVGGRSLLTRSGVNEMLHQQATNHPSLPGWSLGFQLDRVNGVMIAEHGGDIAGFSSLFVLIPEKDVGFFVVHHGEGGDLRFEVKQALMDQLYPESNRSKVPKADPKNLGALREYAGRYISTLSCRTCGEQGDIFEVLVNPNGTVSLWGQSWVPLQRDLFIREDGKRLLGFTRDHEGHIISVTGGSWRVADRLP